MNLETKIAIYKFTPQFFTLTQNKAHHKVISHKETVAGYKIRYSYYSAFHQWRTREVHAPAPFL